MARRPSRSRKTSVPASRTVLIPPRESCCIESDAYDRSAFQTLFQESPALQQLAEHGEALAPHFRELLEDLFCLCFKLEPRLRRVDDVAPSASFNHALVGSLVPHPITAELRAETQLDEVAAGLAAVLLGEQLLRLLREERLVPRGDLLDLWDIHHQEETLRARGEEMKQLEDDQASRDAQENAAHAARVAEAKLRQKSLNLRQRLAEMPERGKQALPATAADLAPKIAEATAEAKEWGQGLGSDGRRSPGRQLELGRRLARNPKLKRLAALVGRMREQALALRRTTFERANEELHAVSNGRDLAHLLPAELVMLRHPLLRRDFQRRLVEGRVLSYALRGLDERGRGPMIVCLDGSGSMAGEKEIWGKAVALTLLEIARRQRRLFRFIGFSSADTPLTTIDLNPRDHHLVQSDRALDLAEHFPGGGTDFETPLRAAVEGLGESRRKRGDVVLISDGECDVSAEWESWFTHQKARLGFHLYSILIDVGSSAVGTLARLSDRVTSVSKLTDDAARDLFLAV